MVHLNHTLLPLKTDDSPSLSEKPLSPQKQSAAKHLVHPGSIALYHKSLQALCLQSAYENRNHCALIVVTQYKVSGLSTYFATVTTC